MLLMITTMWKCVHLDRLERYEQVKSCYSDEIICNATLKIILLLFLLLAVQLVRF